MTSDAFWMCLGCGGLVHIEYFFTHTAFHERTGTYAEFRRLGADDE